MSQADLGRVTGLNPANLSRIETGSADMTVTTQCRVATGLGLTVFQLWAAAEAEMAGQAEQPTGEMQSP